MSRPRTYTFEDPPVSGAEWSRILANYREPNEARSIAEIAITLVPYLSLWTIAAFFASSYPVVAIVLSIPVGFFLMRIFCIQHDCGHYSLFRKRVYNRLVGRILAFFTLTPYAVWQRMHDLHHSNSGNLENRDLGEVHTITVLEYVALSPIARLKYRIYRSPFFLLGAAPVLLFFFQYRLPFGLFHLSKYWISAMSLNSFLVVGWTALGWIFGWQCVVFVTIPSTIIGATAGVFTFFVQHQFEDSHFSRPPDWQVQDAALNGSSFVVMPPWLAWFTANISIHHVHHLYARIPFYRLEEVMLDNPMLADINRISLRESLRCFRFHLWDEVSERMVSFDNVDFHKPRREQA